MAVNGKKKGATYERKIADILGKALKMKFKRTPMSGGWSKETITGDIVPVGEDQFFALSVECKNHKTFPKQVYEWIVQAIHDAGQLKKVPIVIFHITKTTKEDVIRINKTTAIESPFPNGEEFVIMRLSDFLNVANKKKLKDAKKWGTK